ncbi:unnamed protein product [Allacma fusca]|uniref:Uncharacterized protein n=1 Tax=Allacma fusca TaxID=39272 RepID=A0A8J2PKI9_9HEXA|nr:unnamed protein product [Allacma fusca]
MLTVMYDDPQRVFTNNVVVRFHAGLEMEGDEVITIVCRYPPPLVPAPPDFLYIPPAAAVPAVPKPLKEFEVLLIICAVLFLGLMLLGLGCSYYCLKQRNIQVIRKRPFSPIEDDSEKSSGIESFTGLKIPRVHAPSTESSSEVPLEETIASDYPSSIEDQPLRPDTVSSEYSDTHLQVDSEVVPAAVKKPQFAVNLRVAKRPEVPPRYSEEEGSITSVETGVAMSSHVPDLHPPPRRRAPPPVFSRVQDIHEPRRSVQHTELVDTLTVVDKEDVDTETKYNQPLVLARKPAVTVHTVDDVYLQTIVEKRLIEDEERRTREVTQFYKKDQPKWDVVIRSHQAPPPDDDTWDRGSETTDVASSIGWSAVEEPPIRPHYSLQDRETITRRTDVTREDFDRTTVTRAMQKLQQDDARVWNERWKVLLRVLESPPPPNDNISDVGPQDTDYDTDTASVLTEDDREKWRQIITTESTLRTLLTQATVREDYERIRRDTRYEKLFEPEKWDVIIRVLAPPAGPDPADDDGMRFYSDSQSEVSSVAYPPSKPRRNYRKISSGTTNTQKSITDVRSMTEVMVDFAVDDPLGRDDDSSVVSSLPGARSVADRSSTEIVEFAPLDEEDDFDDHLMNLPSGGVSRNNYSTEEHRLSHNVDDDGNLIQQSSTRKVFSSSSSRMTRY